MFENFVEYFNGFKNLMERGSVLSEDEEIIMSWWNYLGDETKFKNVTVCELKYITFESPNRNFELEMIKKGIYKLSFNSKSKDYSISEGEIVGDFYTIRNWFKKRNYLK